MEILGDATAKITKKEYASTSTQAVPRYSLHEVNTVSTTFTSTGVSHTDGCWPREVDPTDGEQVARWRKRTERDEDYLKTVLRLGAIVEDLVMQNNALDIYKDYFSDAISVFPEAPTLDTMASLKLQATSLQQRCIRALTWSPEKNSGRIMLAFTAGSATQQSPRDDGICAVFDVSNPLSPTSILNVPSDPLCVAYSRRDFQTISTGQSNGHCSIFDLRLGSNPVSSTTAQQSHIDAITGIAWTQSNTGTELMTASLDGSVVWWDVRNLSERLETVVLNKEDSNAAAPLLSATCLEYSAAAGATKFKVGTSQGLMLAGNRVANLPTTISAYPGHLGAVRCILHHPQLPKYFLTVGDWSAKIWSEDIKTPLLSTPYYSQRVLAGAWSSQRPAIFYRATEDGHLQAWDLLQSHTSPFLDVGVSDAMLTSLAVQEEGRGLLAVGCSDGIALILQPSNALSSSSSSSSSEEMEALSSMFEREHNLEKISSESKEREKKESSLAAEPITRVTEAQLTSLEQHLMQAHL